MLRRLLLLALVATSTVASASPLRPVRSASFDWDANTVTMQTKIYLKKKGGGELALTLEDYDKQKHLIGKPGALADVYIQAKGPGSSYRDMNELPGQNLFLRDLKKTVEGHHWQGPAWSQFVAQLSTPAGAKRASIITAREHSADSMYEGLKFLQHEGYIRFLPPRDRLFAVNRADIRVDGVPLEGSTPARKLTVQESLLDRLQAAAQRDHGRRQVWHFSDDDWANYEATVNGLKAGIAEKRWPDVDVVVHFTGEHNLEHAPEVVTLERPRI